MDISKVRKDFPVLETQAYLNSAATGPLLSHVKEAVVGWWDAREGLQYVDLPNARGEVANLIHCDEKSVALVHRASQGVNIVAGLVQPRKGDNIVLTDLSYPSSVYPWVGYQGVEIRRISNRDGVIDLSDFEEVIDDETKIVCLNRVEWTSGLRHDVKTITETAHDHGALVLDDAFQAVGAVDVDVSKEDVDFLVFGGEKWMCSSGRAAALYVNPRHVEEYEPSYRFYWRVYENFQWSYAPWDKPVHDNIESWSGPLVKTAERFDPGCVGEDAQCGFHASLKYFNELGIDGIEKRVLGLSEYLIDGLKDLGLKVNTPHEKEKRAGIVTYTMDRYDDNAASYEAMKKEGVMVAHRYTGGVGGIRVSPHFFNTEEEIDRVLGIQKNICEIN
ncbi:MAG: aminotransferase class V-fold PLP-dependent enzyme [Candidatus Bathyarchaeia archaeon]